jgi:hypothetical protein
MFSRFPYQQQSGCSDQACWGWLELHGEGKQRSRKCIVAIETAASVAVFHSAKSLFLAELGTTLRPHILMSTPTERQQCPDPR